MIARLRRACLVALCSLPTVLPMAAVIVFAKEPPDVDARSLPSSLRIEVLREEGAPEVFLDNASIITPVSAVTTPQQPTTRGCESVGGALGLGVLVLVRLLRRRQ